VGAQLSLVECESVAPLFKQGFLLRKGLKILRRPRKFYKEMWRIKKYGLGFNKYS